jgi:hypothetical protein
MEQKRFLANYDFTGFVLPQERQRVVRLIERTLRLCDHRTVESATLVNVQVEGRESGLLDARGHLASFKLQLKAKNLAHIEVWLTLKPLIFR